MTEYMTEEELDPYEEYWLRRAKVGYMGCAVSMFAAAVLAVALALVLLTSCAPPKVVEEHHHHYSEIDTMAVQAQVDKRLDEERTLVVQELTARMQSWQAEQASEEQERERITETVTTWVDSLGRQMRQEQRTTERDISRQQQLREARLQQEFEGRLLAALDSLNAEWQVQIDRKMAHWEQGDSTSVSKTPVPEDNRPWYKRWKDAVIWALFGAAALAAAWMGKRVAGSVG